MKPKEYLWQYKKNERMLENKRYELSNLYSSAYSITANTEGERVSSSGSKQRMEDAIVKFLDAQNNIVNEIEELISKNEEIIKTIEMLDVEEYDVLHKRYIQGIDRQEIARMYDRTKEWFDSIHGRALKHVQEILDVRFGKGVP